MATTLGGSTLHAPSMCTVSDVTVFTDQIMSDGSVVRQTSSSTKRQWLVDWRPDGDGGMLSSSDFSTIQTKALVKTSQLFSPPDEAGTYTVFASNFQWELKPMAGGAIYYNCAVTLREA